MSLNTASATASASGGIGFCGLLTILFIGLKLTNFINWTWWWVLAPLWAPTAVVISIIFVGLVLYIFWSLLKILSRKIFSRDLKGKSDTNIRIV